MENQLCKACGRSFMPRPQALRQSYCSSPDCQQERRREWRRNNRHTNPVCRDNQAQAQQAWRQRNPDYSREYRISHPNYTDRNRILQSVRNAKAKALKIAKSDVSILAVPFPTGIYQIRFLTSDEIAKPNVWIVELTVHI